MEEEGFDMYPSNLEESNTASNVSENYRGNSNAEIEEPTPQAPYKVNDPISYTNAGAKKTGKITEVISIGNGTYGYMLADGTYLPHSRINGINLRSGQGGGARRKRVHKLSRRKSRRATRRRLTRRC